MSVSGHSYGELLDFDKPTSQAVVALSSSSSGKSIAISRGSLLLSPAQKRHPVGQTFCAASAGEYTYGESLIESHSDTTEDRVGVLLLNLGGPETLHDVQPFLFNLFADPVCFTSFLCFPYVSFVLT